MRSFRGMGSQSTGSRPGAISRTRANQGGDVRSNAHAPRAITDGGAVCEESCSKLIAPARTHRCCAPLDPAVAPLPPRIPGSPSANATHSVQPASTGRGPFRAAAPGQHKTVTAGSRPRPTTNGLAPIVATAIEGQHTCWLRSEVLGTTINVASTGGDAAAGIRTAGGLQPPGHGAGPRCS